MLTPNTPFHGLPARVWRTWVRCIMLCCTCVLLGMGVAQAQGNVFADTSFDPGAGPDSSVYTLAVQQPGGKVLIGGAFTSVDGIPRNHIARLNADGTLDLSFNPGTGTNSFVETLAVQPDGKVLIGGQFTDFNGTPRNHIARLNADGSLDTSFNPGAGADALVNTLVVQSNGKVLVGGYFNNFDATPRNHIARLNADGSLDTTFAPGAGPNGLLETLAVQSGDKVLIGGNFTSYNGTTINRIARLNADGTLDTSFNVGSGASSVVYAVVAQSDGRVLIGGDFTSFNSTPRNGFARLNADGTLDTSFDPGAGASIVTTLAVQPDGKILFGSWSAFARLNADGSLDTSFDTGAGTGIVQALAIQPDGKVLIGGTFNSFNGTSRNNIARLTFAVTITPSVQGGNGSISPASVQTVQVGNLQSFTLTPNAGYRVDGVNSTCGGTLSGNTFTLTAAFDCTVQARFNVASNNAVQSIPLFSPWALVAFAGLLAWCAAALARQRRAL